MQAFCLCPIIWLKWYLNHRINIFSKNNGYDLLCAYYVLDIILSLSFCNCKMEIIIVTMSKWQIACEILRGHIYLLLKILQEYLILGPCPPFAFKPLSDLTKGKVYRN